MPEGKFSHVPHGEIQARRQNSVEEHHNHDVDKKFVRDDQGQRQRQNQAASERVILNRLHFSRAPTIPNRPEGLTRSRPITSRKPRSEEHTSELQSLMRISYAVFCLNKKK